jgi:hypothetical protein
MLSPWNVLMTAHHRYLKLQPIAFPLVMGEVIA